MDADEGRFCNSYCCWIIGMGWRVGAWTSHSDTFVFGASFGCSETHLESVPQCMA